MKKFYSLLFTMLLAFVGAEDAWGQIDDGNYYLKHKETGQYLCDDVYLSLTDNKSAAAIFTVYKDMGYYVFKTGDNYLSVPQSGIPEISELEDYFTLDGSIDQFTIFCFYSNNYLINYDGYLYTGNPLEYWTLETVDDDPGTTPVSPYQVDVMGHGEDGYYGTFYADKACEIPEGYTAYVVSSVSNGAVELNHIVSGNEVKGNVLAANTPVIIKGNQGTIELPVSKSNGSSASTNLLAGSLENGSDNEAGFYYYKLAYNSEGTKLGFYWEAGTGGTYISTHPNKAYLKVPISQASSNALSFRFFDEPTGVKPVCANQDETIYNLHGQIVKGNVSGVYVKNGKKYIVK